MRYLYVDTSSPYLYSAIVEDNKVLDQVKKKFGVSLSEEALPEIANMFTKNIILPKDIDKILVVNGPGSFTGIRIGLTIAKTYKAVDADFSEGIEKAVIEHDTDKE